jgi:hypothetical protein
MPVVQQVFGWSGVLQMWALFGILLYRQHYRRVPVFTMYAGGLAITSALYGFHYSWETWMAHQLAAAALRFGVALELTNSIFGAFPAAATTARRAMFAIFVATAVAAMASTPDAAYMRVHADAIPRLASGGVWMLTALAGLVLWYRLPLAPLPRAILMGYAPYLLVFTIAMSLLFDVEWQPLRRWVGYVDTLAFFALVNYWCRVSWRTAPEAARSYSPSVRPEAGLASGNAR